MESLISQETPQIPKVIHYCWFGGKPLPELAIKCIDSWKKYFPSYEIKEWNEKNFDVNCCDYFKEAYSAKKWAFLSDYARFRILYLEGGLYFDTDVEIIRPIDDLITKGPFMGCEPTLSEGTPTTSVNPGLGLAANPGLKLYKNMLEFYEQRHFITEDGSYDETTVVEYTTAQLKKAGLTETDNIQCIGGIFIYPKDYFCPMNYATGELLITENTRCIHHYMASWKNSKEQKQIEVIQKLNRKFGSGKGYILGRIYTLPYRILQKFKYKGIWGTIKLALTKAVRR